MVSGTVWWEQPLCVLEVDHIRVVAWFNRYMDRLNIEALIRWEQLAGSESTEHGQVMSQQ